MRGWTAWKANRKWPSSLLRLDANSNMTCLRPLHPWTNFSSRAEMDKLIRAEILLRKGRPPDCTYLFKHALLEDALYNSLIKSKRQDFHRRVADALETAFPETAKRRPELIAHHYTEAGLSEKAVGYWFKAGLRSKERSADVEAIGHLTKGLGLLEGLEETSKRDAKKLAFLTSLGPASISVRGYAAPEVGPTLQQARDLAHVLGIRNSSSEFCWVCGNGAWSAANCSGPWPSLPTERNSPRGRTIPAC